ncbi:MAG TPA: cupin domain-containing protein [Steroidobacteraceae bacterium]|nr:cupin domain-containing protein [Steroidobacteraceae bacterium]
MSDRASELIRALRLEPHPEGGHYREIYRSAARVTPAGGRAPRRALTSIYYLLKRGELSRLHRVASDEVWHFYRGGTLELIWASDDFRVVTRTRLGNGDAGSVPCAVVPAGHWQAALPLDGYALVGCTVAPGFEFDDFRLLRDDSQALARLEEREPGLRVFV